MTDAAPLQPRSAVAPPTRAHDERLRDTWPIGRRQALQLLVGFAAIVGCGILLGELLTGPFENSALTRADERFAEWLERRRTPAWNTSSLIGSSLAETWVKALVTGTIAAVLLKVWKRWFEALIIAGSLIIEAAAFLCITLVVGRPRPAVSHLDGSPIGSSFPSGHVAAAVAYTAIALVVFWHTRNQLARWAIAVACAVIPVLVGISRMYRGMHFLSDVVAGVFLGIASVVLTVAVLRRSPAAPREFASGENGEQRT